MKALGTDYLVIVMCEASCMSGKGYDYIASKAWPKCVSVCVVERMRGPGISSLFLALLFLWPKCVHVVERISPVKPHHSLLLAPTLALLLPRACCCVVVCFLAF